MTFINGIFRFQFLEKARPEKQEKLLTLFDNHVTKMRLFMFLVFSQHGLACKYEITPQVSIYSGM